VHHLADEQRRARVRLELDDVVRLDRAEHLVRLAEVGVDERLLRGDVALQRVRLGLARAQLVVERIERYFLVVKTPDPYATRHY
jgi:hypothetical protein